MIRIATCSCNASGSHHCRTRPKSITSAFLFAPHLGNCGNHDTAWVGEYTGAPMLMAKRGESALALACSPPWIGMSVGFVGYSDGCLTIWISQPDIS